MRLTFEKIDICDLVIIDLTEKSVGLGIEAGYAYAKKYLSLQ
jgi:nucleoside 2-deoxyribosyltransferase